MNPAAPVPLTQGETKMGSPKITEADVSVIKQRLANGEYQYVIARDYPVSQQTISHIALGRIWEKVKPKE